MEDFGIQKAIPMITVDQKTGKYVMTPQAIQFLRSIQGPIGVVSVAGLYRTGKSYLLNRVLLNRSNGFGVGPTVNPCTKGLWCWGKTLKGHSNEGEQVNIIVIDTEGIGALDQDQNHDTKIFTLAILASSCFIYNSTGSIDQNAIQNLSLVVNLTKHIQLKSGGQNQYGEDADQMSMYFPSFFWVVRDFSLQLQDPQGNQITSKEYLERALAPQNGFTDDIEQKNRIRRLLTAFFKQRDCITMIRPLVNENDLQILDQLSYDKLRPQFVQKALSFRKRITSSIKTKTLNNKKLNGDLYCSMLVSYIQAINDGAVPNIQNAWNYMCEQQCRKSLDQCYQIFVKLIIEGFRDFPRPEEQFYKVINDAQDIALDNFRERALGDKTSQFIKELKARIKQKIRQVKQQNIKQSLQQTKKYIQKNITLVTKKLNSQQYNTFSEFLSEVNGIADKLTKQGLKLHDHKIIYAQAFKKLITQGAQYMFKGFIKEQNKRQELQREKQRQILHQLQKCKQQRQTLRKDNLMSTTDYQQKLQTLNFKIEVLKTELEYAKRAQEQNDQKMKSEQLKTQTQFSQLKNKLQTKLNEVTSKYEQVSRQYKNDQNLWEKEKAVAEQTIKQKNALIQQYNRKQNKLTTQTSIERAQLLEQHKESIRKYQRQISNRTNQINLEKEKTSSLSQELEKMKLQYNQTLQKLEQKEKKLKEQSTNFKKEMQRMKRELEDKSMQYEQKYSKIEQKSKSESYQIETKLRETQQKLSQLNIRFKKQKNQMQTEIQMKKNQIKYNLQEIQNLKQSNARLAQNEKSLMATFEASFTQEKDKVLKQRMNQLTTKHDHQISEINHTFQMKERQFTSEIYQLKKQLEEAINRQNQLNLNMQNKTLQSEMTIKQLNQQIIKLKNGKQMQEGSRMRASLEKQQYFRKQIQNLQDEIEEMKDTTARERRQQMRKNEEQIATIKNSYQLQRQNLQRRLKSQKQKYIRRQNQLIMEHERKYQEQTEQLKQRISELEEENQSNIQQFRNVTMNLQHQTDVLKKQKSNLQKINQEYKNSLQKRQKQSLQKQENMMKAFKQQKEKLEDKIEQMLNESNNKEKEIMNLSHQRQQLQNNLEKKETKLVEIEKQFVREKERYENEKAKLKQISQNKEGQLTNKIKTLEKQYALVLQQKEFRQNKITELEKTLSISTVMNEEKYNKLRQQKTMQLKIMEDRLTNEKNILQTKYRDLKVSSKENQTANKRAQAEMIKEKATFEEKIITLEARIRSMQENKQLQISTLRKQIKQLKDEKYNNQIEVQKELQRYKKQKENLQSIINDNELRYIKQKSLAEQKIEFLDRGKNQMKKELEERIKKLEQKLQLNNNARMSEKSSIDSNYNEAMRNLQSQYRKRIQQLNDSSALKLKQIQNKLKEQQNMYKELSQKSQMQNLENKMSITNLEKKINQLNQNERRVNNQNQILKRQKQLKDSEYLEKQKKDRENYRQKIQQLEQKCQDAENIRKNSFYQYEKEKIKWNTERQNLDDIIQNFKDSLAKSEREKQKLKQDNNKLKNDKKSTTKGHSYISNLKTYYQPSSKPMTKDELNKQNVIHQ